VAHKDSNAIQLEAQEIRLCQERLEKISHDFRTPLNIIIGFTELLLDEAPGKINDDQRSCLNDILESSQRLLRLVNKTFVPSSSDSKKVLIG